MSQIRITGYRDAQMWYNGLIGEIYAVLDYDDAAGCFEVPTRTGRNIVYKEDCEFVYDSAASIDKAVLEDAVTSPSHYNTGGIECIDGIEAALTAEEYQGYLRGNAMKYLWRCNYKGNKQQDLAKASWYINRLTAGL